MKEGIYALASLDGAPLLEDDLSALGLREHVLEAQGIAVRVIDRQPEAVQILKRFESLTVLLGFLDEPEELAGSLGLSSDTAPVALAEGALQRFGREAPARMLGEWSLLHWDVRARQLTLLSSEARRDVMYFARDAHRVAVSPSMLALGDLPGVGHVLNPVVFAMFQARNGLRHTMGDETIWTGIRSVLPAARVRFTRAECTVEHPDAAPPPELWTGSFEEAVEATDAVGRRILRQLLGRFGSSAALLSGGLDSSLMTTWAALERGPGRELFCLSSAAPPGSGLADETEFSKATAQALGLRQTLVWSPADWSLYQPSAAAFAFHETPLVPTRDPTYRALYTAARQGGAKAVLDGVFGELSATAGLELPETRSWPRRVAANLRDRLVARRARGGWPEKAFQVRLSKELMAELPAHWPAIWRKGPPPFLETRPEAPMGISAAMRKNAFGDTATAVGLRHLIPYRDRRLLRVTSRVPVKMLLHEGLSRPLARRMLLGRLPDSVRLRTQGMPFAPDYPLRLREQAAAARARVDVYRDAGLGRWLDLEWLRGALHETGSGSREGFSGLYEVQMTAIAAEFLLWVGSTYKCL